jgi:aconitate hydratase
MGVLPLQYENGYNAEKLGLTGNETFAITGLSNDISPLQKLNVIAKKENGEDIKFKAIARVDSKIEIEYYRHGGILQYVLRQFLEKANS